MRSFFNVGALNISIEYDRGCQIFLDRALQAFTIDSIAFPDIRFRVDITSPFPDLALFRVVFTSQPVGLWTILEDHAETSYLISLQNLSREPKPYTIIRACREFSDFIIYADPSSGAPLAPLEYPLADLAVSGHININHIGIILHAACVSFRGRAYLFAGVSGSGKSTLSALWQLAHNAQVLTDERTLIRYVGNKLWAFGTPWHGTAEILTNKGAPIEKIFFIKHGRENKATPLPKTDAVHRLLVRCFPTFWNKKGMHFALDFCAEIAEKTECYELSFVNNRSITEYLQAMSSVQQHDELH